ncbi:MAG: hypothetical protein ACP5HG_00975 [Anaerolineae bacterium]|jgi:hypothetical protein
MTKTEKEWVVKMQETRQAVKRLRNLRSATPQIRAKQSWFERLQKRLGLLRKTADPE